MTDEKLALYDRAIAHYGVGAQVMKAVEEFAELTQALCKASAAGAEMPHACLADLGDHISEEMADALIMWEQLLVIFGNAKVVSAWLDKKRERLRARLDAAEGAERSDTP